MSDSTSPPTDPENTGERTVAEEIGADETATVRASQFPTGAVTLSNAATPTGARHNDRSEGLPAISRAALTSLAPSEPNDGEVLGKHRYEALELIGVGGEGRVYSALDRNFRRAVAIKVMRSGTSDDARRRDAFIKEARITALLEHPNILPVYDIDTTDDGRTYFTMRKAQGHSLSSLLKAARARPETPPEEIATWDKIVRIIDKVCDAVAYAHSVGYVHQDIKPGNVILGAFGNVLLVDWGTALSREERTNSHLKVVGTPTYMSPEQARAEPVDERTDVYCIGATLFHLVTQKPPITEPDPVTLWEKKCAGHVDAVECPAGVPEELLTIARRAMAAAPADRFQSVTELQQALREVQHHDQSLALSSAVAARLSAPEPIADYDEATALLARAQGALDLWPENERALRLSSEVRARHVELALQTGDLALAERLLGSPVADRDTLKKRLALAHLTRHRQRLRARLTAGAVGLALILLASLAVFMVRDHYLQTANWREVATYDLTSAQRGRSMGRSRERLDQTDAVPEDQFGNEGFSLKPQETYWFTQAPNRGDFRFELSVKWTRRVDGVELLADAQRAQPAMFWHAPSGLTCQFGGWQGTATYFTVQEKAGMPDSSGAVSHDFAPGRWYDLVFERREGRVRLYVDGAVVLEDFVFVPFEGKDNRWFAMRAWNQPVVVRRVRIQRLSLPEKTSPVVAGDSLFRLGMYADAVEQYEMVADDHRGSAVEEVALAKAYLAVQRLGARDRRLGLLAKLEHAYPDSPYLGRCIEEEAVASWREGRYDDAIRRISQAFARKPESRVAVEILAGHERARWPTEAVHALMPWVGKTTDVHRLDLSGLGLTSLDFLRQTRIDDLALDDNRVTSIAPLSGIELRYLRLRNNPISNLEPLTGKHLSLLDVSGTLVENLSPLERSGLKELILSRSKVKDLSVAGRLPLDRLQATGLGLTRLDPLRGLQVTQLEIDDNAVESLEPLRGMPIETLRAANNRIRSLEPLRGAPLTDLLVPDNPLEGVGAVAAMKNLVNVDLGGCNVGDLTPFVRRRFDRLTLRYNGLRDVGLLATVEVKHLELSHNDIRDASPLAGSHAEYLDLWENPLESLGPIADAPPNQLWISGNRMSSSLSAELARKWHVTASTRDLAYVLDVQRAWVSRDRQRLLDLRRRVDGRWYLPLYVDQTWTEARASAEFLGAHLFWLRDVPQGDRLHETLPLYVGGYWQDYRIGDHVITAPDGHRLDPVDLFFENSVWDHQGSTGVAYAYVEGFGSVVMHWKPGSPAERQMYQPLLEWDDGAR